MTNLNTGRLYREKSGYSGVIWDLSAVSDEDFMTPSSTPLNEREDCEELEKEPDGKSEISFASEATPESVTESSIRSRIYDRLVIVCC